jgi:geranylgeranyl diphosphate synthase, type II
MDHPSDLKRMVASVEAAIDRLLPAASEPSSRLHEAMRYSMQAGGKRLRPVLLLCAARLFPAGRSDPLAAAVAVECVHTYSLVHDDLPCMDNDDLRRGKPTAHKAFDEATALLAGDALLTRSFGILAESYSHDPSLVAALVSELAGAAGSRRLIGGQMEDLLAEKNGPLKPDDLAFIHLNKTAAMIEASLAMGARCGGAPEAFIGVLRGAGRDLGLAFQVEDDILDATSDSRTLGKTAGKDARDGKATYVSLHGVEAARRIARERSEAAIAALRSLPGETGFLIWLAGSLVGRSH